MTARFVGAEPDFDPTTCTFYEPGEHRRASRPGRESTAGLLTQGGQGGRPAPLAWHYHGFSPHSSLNLHAT